MVMDCLHLEINLNLYSSARKVLQSIFAKFYLHLNPGSCSPTSVCLRSPGASTCPIIDAKVTVMLHLKPEWLASLVVCPGRPYGIAARIEDKIAIFLHSHRESPITALQHLPISNLAARCQMIFNWYWIR